MKTRLKPPAISEETIRKNRYDEARAIKDAWDYRLSVAQKDLSYAMRTGGDVIAARNTFNAIEIQVADAAGELRIARTAWVNHALPTERRAA